MKDLNELLNSFYENEGEYLGCIPNSIYASDCQSPSLDKANGASLGNCGKECRDE